MMPRDAADRSEGATPRDRPFKPERRARSEAAKTLVDAIVRRLEAFEERKGLRLRARRSVDQRTFCATVEALVCDALHRHFTAPKGWLAVPISKRVLARKDRYRSVVMGKQLPDVLMRLASGSLRLIRVEKGERGRLTTFRATAALVRMAGEAGVSLHDVVSESPREIILLRGPKPRSDKKGPLRKYDDSEQTARYRDQLTTINRALIAADITVVGVPEVDASDRLLSRTFNDDSFERGGRLNGGFWMELKREVRLRAVRIGGESVVELDFGQCATRIVYGLAGAPLPPGDLYAVPRFNFVTDAAQESYLYFPRAGVKRVLNAMIYASRRLDRFPRGTRRHFPRESIADVTARIAARHAAIGSLFYGRCGMQAMWIESEVLVEVLIRSMEQGIVALPIHDAVLVKVSAVEPVREIMLTSFQRLAGVQASVTASSTSTGED